MTILLYDYCELEERAGKHLRIWKIWHLIIYILIAVCGIANFTLFDSTKQLVDGKCFLYPRQMTFHLVQIPDDELPLPATDAATNSDDHGSNSTGSASKDRIIQTNETTPENNLELVGNFSSRLVLSTDEFIGADEDCRFAEYMPIVSTMVALLWTTLFVVCPSGGRVRSGLQQPWRVLPPALVCAAVLVALTGHGFVRTNGGLQAFCGAFYNYTNATTCSAASPYLERTWHSSASLGLLAAGARAASAAVWCGWACAFTLLLARCMAAPDFVVKRTAVTLTKDPGQKIIPYLKSPRSSPRSPLPRDTLSVRSEPTVSTQLVTASVEPGLSAPTSLVTTPTRHLGEAMEMAHRPRELN